MSDHDPFAELTDYLRAEGHSEDEIRRILLNVQKYELETQHDSIMDSIGNGTLDLAALIKEALGEG
jgi:hypothetical protein